MKDSKKYLNNIKKLFPIYGKKEREFIKGIESQIEKLGHCSYEDIIDEIGEPTDIISTYYQETDTQYLLRKLNSKRLIRLCCVIITISVLTASLWRSYNVYKAFKDFHESIPVEYEEVIEELE